MKKNVYNILRKFTLVLNILLLVLVPMARAQAEEGVHTPGIFRVGMEVNYAPFNWTQATDANQAYPVSNSPGEFANGYDVQIAKDLAQGLGLDLEIVKLEWDGLVPALQSGKIDAIIAGMSPTEERKKEIDFSDSYYTSDLVIVVKKGSPLETAQSIQDFRDAKITGQLNTFHYDVLDQIEGYSKPEALDSFSTMILNTKTDKIDGYVSEKPGALSATNANQDLTFVEFEDGQGFQTSEEETSIAVGLRKGSALAGQINTILDGLTEDDREAIMEEAVALQVDSEAEQRPSFFQDIKNILNNYGSLFLRGVAMTLLISITATILGLLIGIFVAVVRKADLNKAKSPLKYYLLRLAQGLLTIYVEVFRGSPMMVQAILIFYGIPYLFGINTNPLITAIVVVSINTGAYLSEVVRGGINSIDQGQFEASKALGMTQAQAMGSIILPQALRNVIPSIGNEFIINVKDTSVLNVISVTELFFMARSVSGTTNQYFQTYIIVMFIYLFLTFVITRILFAIEKRMFKREDIVLESSTGGHLNG